MLPSVSLLSRFLAPTAALLLLSLPAAAAPPAAPKIESGSMTIPGTAFLQAFGYSLGTMGYCVTWLDNSADENFFQIQIFADNKFGWSPLTFVGANTTSWRGYLNLTGPPNNFSFAQGQAVKFRVRAVKGTLINNGTDVAVTEWSAWTDYAQINYYTTPDSTFLAPQNFIMTPVAGKDAPARYAWTGDSNKEEYYDLEFGTASGNYTAGLSAELGFNASPGLMTLAGLEPERTYYSRVRAKKVSGVSGNALTFTYSGYSNETAFTMPKLNTPSGLTITQKDERTATVSWIDNSSNEHGYLIQVRTPSSTTFQTVVGTASNDTSEDVPWFPNLATEWQVLAAFDTGVQNANYKVSNPTPAASFKLDFKKPINVGVVMSGNLETGEPVATITWTDQSAIETGFGIVARPAGSSTFTLYATANANTNLATITGGLLPGTVYEFGVFAFYQDGGNTFESDYSILATGTTKDGFKNAPYAPITLGQAFTFTLETSNVSPRTSIQVLDLPPGLSFDSGTMKITGTPTEGGLYESHALATFADGWVARQTIALRVLTPPAAPQKPVTITARTVPVGSASLPLAALFSEPDTEAAVRMATTVGHIDIVLQPTLTPQTYANFMEYVNDPDPADNYNDAVIHRVTTDFVVQGGGYKALTSEGADKFAEVTRKPSPINEPGISNVAGTIAMAKGSGVSSATHDFFFNLLNNSSQLDPVDRNSFTAFGRVAGNGMSTTVQNIVNLPGKVYDVQIKPSGSTTFSTFNPLEGLADSRWPINDASAPSSMDNSKVVKINTVTPLPVMTYNISHNSDPTNVSATISGSDLVLQGLQDGTSSTVTIQATDLDGNVTTQSFLVDVLGGVQAPEITTQPEAQTVTEGDDVTFTVIATGGSGLAYQWRKNGINLAGQTSSSLLLSDVTIKDMGNYSVVVSNNTGVVISNAVALTVNQLVDIVAQPQSISRPYGTSAGFVVVAVGTGPLTYKWYKGDDLIASATSASYTINNLLMTDAGSFKVTVTNALNEETSAVVTLTVTPVDTDHDGLYNHEELARTPPTNPNDADSDNDNFADGLEVGTGSDPSSAGSTPPAGTFYAAQDTSNALNGIAMRQTPSGVIPDRLNGTSVTVPEWWLGAYELTNQQFALILQEAKERDLIAITTESGRRVVRYPKTSGEIVCYLATPAASLPSDPESTAVDMDNVSFSFLLPASRLLEAASGITWHGAYLCTVVLNQIHGYTDKNVVSSWSYTSQKGYQIPDYTAWELAARGGAALPPTFGSLYPTGSTVTAAKANYNNLTTSAGPKKVGSYVAGKLGLFDMAGNVAEWIFQSDATVSASSYTRGGSFADPATELLNSADESRPKATASRRVGVRLALTESRTPVIPNNGQPQPIFQRTDEPLTLSVLATGAPPLSYQWYKNNVAIKGKTSRELTIPSPVLNDAGIYHVVVSSNGVNPTVSNKVPVALVEAFAAPPLTAVAVNKTTSLEAKVKGAPGQTFKYQWRIGTTNLVNDVQTLGAAEKKMTLSFMQPNNSAVYNCKVKLEGQNPDNALPEVFTERQVQVMVHPTIPDIGTLPGATISGTYSYTLPMDGDPGKAITTWKVTGLPAGLVFNPATGVISGKPIEAGTATIKISGSNLAGVADTRTATLSVDFLDGNASGTFVGLIDRHAAPGLGGDLGGRLDLTIATTGRFTGKVTFGAKQYPFTSGVLDAIDGSITDHDPSATVIIPRAGLPALKLYFKIKLSDQTLRDSYVGEMGPGGAAPTTTAAITGWRNKWLKFFSESKQHEGTMNAAFTIPTTAVGDEDFPQGASYATVKIDAYGSVTTAGKLADNTSFTCTSSLSPTGQVAVYKELYLSKGSVWGKFNVAETTKVLSGTETLHWLRKDFGATSTERSYKRGFNLPLSVQGGVYGPPVGALILAGLPPTTPYNAVITFTEGGLPGVAEGFDQVFAISAPSKVNMPTGLANPQQVSFTPKAGGFLTGFFHLSDDDPTSTTTPKKKIPRKVTWYGLLIPKAGQPGKSIGYGYFTLPGLPGPGGVTSANSPILSGKMVFDEYVPPPP